jgi:hypothetical protein
MNGSQASSRSSRSTIFSDVKSAVSEEQIFSLLPLHYLRPLKREAVLSSEILLHDATLHMIALTAVRTSNPNYKTITLLLSSSSPSLLGAGIRQPRGGIRVPVKDKTSLPSTPSRPAMGPTQAAIQWVQEGLSPAVKRSERGADYSPTATEVKNTCIYTSTPPYAFTAYCLTS